VTTCASFVTICMFLLTCVFASPMVRSRVSCTASIEGDNECRCLHPGRVTSCKASLCRQHNEYIYTRVHGAGSVMIFCAVALGTPSLLQNLPRQQSNQDLDDDNSQDVAELSSLGVDDSSAGGLGQMSGSETSTVDGGDIKQGDAASSSQQVILRLLEDGETVSCYKC